MATKAELRQRQDALLAVYAEASRELMEIPGVVGVGLGLKEIGGQLSDQIAFRVYVQEKKALTEVPVEQRIPASVQGFPTDVLKIYAVKETDFAERRDLSEYRPLKGGIAVTSKAMTQISEYGTLGWFGRKQPGNQRVILTNCHVLYRDSDIGTTPLVRTAVDKLAQPIYKHTCCCECNVIGATIIGLKNTLVDCAIASLEGDPAVSLVLNNSHTTQNLRVDGTDTAIVGEAVRKVGARSSYTEGIVVDIGAAVEGTQVTLPNGQPTHVRVGQIIIWPAPTETYIDDHFGGISFCNEGDSGSVVIDSENKIVGLIFAAHPLPNHSLCIANHIGTVLQQLQANGHEIVLEVSPPGGGTIPVLATRGPRTLQDLLSDCPPWLNELVEKHRTEVPELIDHCRPVTVAWRRGQGPAFAAALVRSNREPGYRIPTEIGGVRRHTLLTHLATALIEHGSAALREDLLAHQPSLIENFTQYNSVRGILAAFETQALPTPVS